MATAPYRNAVGLPPDNLSLLEKVLEKLKESDARLYERLLCYLLDGDSEEVLGDLARLVDAATKFRLACAQQYSGFSYGDVSWHVFLNNVQTRDIRFLLRLARSFEAAARNLPPDRFMCQDLLEKNRWLELLLQEATLVGPKFHSFQTTTRIYAIEIVKMLAADGHTPDAFLTAPFRTARSRKHMAKHWATRNLLLSVNALGAEYVRHRDLIAPFLASGTAEMRAIAVENLVRTKTPPEPFAAELVQCATDSSKTLREAAEPLVRTMSAAAQPLLECVARTGSRPQREHSVRLLGRICGPSAREFLAGLREIEKSAPVRELIDAALGELGAATAPAPEPEELPPRTPLDLHPPVTPALRAAVAKIFDAYNAHAACQKDVVAKAVANRFPLPYRPLEPLVPDDLDRVCRQLEEGGSLRGSLTNTLTVARSFATDSSGAFQEFLAHPDCRLIHVVRLLAMQNLVESPSDRHSGFVWGSAACLAAFRAAHEPPITLLDVADALRSLSITDEIILREALEGYGAFDWEWEAVWPYFMDRLEHLERAFEPAAGDWSARYRQDRARNNAYRILSGFRRVPPSLVGRLWELAIGPTKADRQKAQPICEKLPDVHERLTQALSSGSSATRMIAAEWLGRRGDERAIAPLTAAAKKEKQDAALDAMLTALERLGESIEPFLDREKLQADAVKNLKKGTPPALGWFPWATLPQVHWKDTGCVVPPETITWLIMQSFKLKSPEPGPLLKRYCDLMQPAEREVLGNFVLTAWLNQDLLRKYSDDEARQLARQKAPQLWQQWQASLQWYQKQNHPIPANYPQSLQQCEEQEFRQLVNTVGSAVAEKGILAVAGACCGDAAVGPVQKFLKEWYGHRAAQCKALIAMLSGVDRPLAIQYLLSISNRFRTKGIREEAEKYVNLLAERKGWTLDELADRTMPTCGLDEDGKLELNFGPRSFIARVNAELDLVLYDGGGQALKKLPDPRKDDDPELAKAAKKAFSTVKTDLKKFIGLTTTRLYEAMCTERTWPVADWRMYLLGHPLARLLCQRLVWAVMNNGQVTATFRPLDDGSLTDVQDNAVTLPDGAQIRISHSCSLPPESSRAWLTHLADYSIEPLFTQFGRPPYELADGQGRETAVKAFEGHMVEAFKLRGLATKYGYTRGQAEDGGWFYEYQKSFPGLGLEVHLGFSGNGLPEENRLIALTHLNFERKSAQESPASMTTWGRGAGVPLKDVPQVLLSECVGDLRAIAAAGSGFDPDWEKKAMP